MLAQFHYISINDIMLADICYLNVVILHNVIVSHCLVLMSLSYPDVFILCYSTLM